MPATEADHKNATSRSPSPHKQKSPSHDALEATQADRASHETSIPIVRPTEAKPRDASSQEPDRTRSELLQQYNELRDVGQQLIGMIAEQRGVPIRTLYESGEFGVGPED
ncbi:hypothetical protein MGG_16388 [Pyricularia oryzae 70-15]|uniref:DNA repair protein Swi5/Sae3 n=1 Tax=Pyricularia oryzae (strain 70-15 / ATCC MYA-4617 / FGSC 8958) TaxID=242507 RepID=G4MM95_PYRO7|nr:uncharacterized protein MGG_16388 [Pyricularia oryzae 70-15]EHA57776.1 hypothetical protein MGG_16388 [Pyricularia oryzae 70-15]KAI7915008.1 hypothetical protein M9X92_008671 [Pyricularia oryzae]KAI7915452.1 hypothetical protein M0657_009035 [Pyricularia oryzae]